MYPGVGFFPDHDIYHNYTDTFMYLHFKMIRATQFFFSKQLRIRSGNQHWLYIQHSNTQGLAIKHTFCSVYQEKMNIFYATEVNTIWPWMACLDFIAFQIVTLVHRFLLKWFWAFGQFIDKGSSENNSSNLWAQV